MRWLRRQHKRGGCLGLGMIGFFILFCFGNGGTSCLAGTDVTENTLLVEWVEGKALLLDPVKGIWVELGKGMEVPAQGRVRTEENSRLILKSSFSSMQIEPASEIEVQKLLQEWSETKFLMFHSKARRWEQEFNLKEGEVYIQVKPNQKKSRFLIETETAVMAVRGTFFKVTRFSDLKVDVLLRDGKLSIKNKIKPSELLLTEGNRLKVDPDIFLQKRHVQPLSPMERQELEGPKKSLSPLVALEIKEPSPPGAESGQVFHPGPYERDRLASWRQNYFFKPKEMLAAQELFEVEQKWKEVKNVAQLTSLDSGQPTSIGINPARMGEFGRMRGKNATLGTDGSFRGRFGLMGGGQNGAMEGGAMGAVSPGTPMMKKAGTTQPPPAPGTALPPTTTQPPTRTQPPPPNLIIKGD